MLQKINTLEDMTQIISLDCSSITGRNATLCNNYQESFRQSIINLKCILPNFRSEFNEFRQEIIQMTYLTVNKLMNVIKNKCIINSRLQQDLQKSQNLTNGMKNQVIQLKQMISQFMQSYNSEINIKQKQLKIKQTQIQQLKNIMKANFNSPRNFCQNCAIKLNLNNQQSKQIKFQELEINQYEKKLISDKNQQFNQNNNKKEEVLIQMSQSILFSRQIDSRIPLQIILQEGSDINSLTDYLHSHRLSHTQSSNGNQNDREIISSRNILITQNNDLRIIDQSPHPINISNVIYDSQRQKSSSVKTQKNNNIFIKNLEQKKSQLQNYVIYGNDNDNDNKSSAKYGKFSSRNHNKSYNNQFTDIQKQRRCSQQLVNSQYLYPEQKNNQSTNFQPTPNNNISEASQASYSNINQNFNDTKIIKTKLQDLSKSSSTSDLFALGQTDRINLPKKFQSPKKMNFVKKNSARTNQGKQQRLKTQPTPRQYDYDMNKQNINIPSQLRQVDINRKIFAKKKNIINHISSKKVQATQIQLYKQIQSPPKNRPVNLFKASIMSNNIQVNKVIPNNHIKSSSFNDSSIISTINQSTVKSHHEYHSASKNISNTPKAHKSLSKSKQKIKVTSKPSNKYLVEQFNNFKKSKGNVHLGVKLHMKRNLQQIKNALKNYFINTQLKQIYYDGKFMNQLKEGFGKIIYENGIIYEGILIQGQRQGNSKLILNGIQIFEGNFQNDKINGQGYLKSLKFLSLNQCCKILQNSSYFGKFQNNKFDGMGTLFLNQKQKIVTKFKSGIPYGQLTFYNENDIQFGYWPTQ